MGSKLGAVVAGVLVVAALAASPGATAEPQARAAGLLVDRSPRFGTAAFIRSAEGRLTGPTSGEPVGLARKWVTEHRGLFAMGPGTGLKVTRDGVLPGTGLHAVVFRQIVSGMPTMAGGVIGVNVLADGGIATVWADVGPTGVIETKARISALAAAMAVSKTTGAAAPAAAGSRDEFSFFKFGDRAGSARLAVLPTKRGPRLVWRVFLPKAEQEVFTAAVDATNGSVLYLRNRVKHAEGLVFRNHPGAERGGHQEMVSFDGDRDASPSGWVGPAAITTAGNNAVAFSDFIGIARTPPNTAPVAPTGSFDFPHRAAWEADCAPVTTPAGDVAENPSYLRDLDASTTNLFYLVNTYHDLLYKLGFTEEMGNFQFDNFGKGGRGADPIEAAAMSGIATGSTNNAYFITSPDGGEPISADGDINFGSRTAMFLFRPQGVFQAPCRNGSLDAQIVFHELTHGLTTRLAGGPDDAESLFSAQGGAMGEAWGDWFALHLLHQAGLETTTAVGAYVTGNPETGIRNFSAGDSPLTYGDFGFGFFGPEVHDDGEIWLATLWDLRKALVARHGAVGGAERAGHLVFDAMVLAGLPNPTFLQQRDAILQADKLRYGSSDHDLIWDVFARRGMGASATTTGPDDTEPHPGFDRPGTKTMLRGIVRDADSGALLPGVNVAVGFGEGGATPAAVTDDRGAFSLPAVPGRYRVTYQAPGYGLRQADVVVGSSGVDVAVRLPKNLASVAYGGRALGGFLPDGAGESVIDDDDTTGPLVTLGQPLGIHLGGEAPLPVSSVQVALRFNGLPDVFPPMAYTVELSADGNTWQAVRSVTIPRRKPVPVVDDLSMVEVVLPKPINAAFIRLTANSPILPELTVGSITEVQVFGSAPSLAPAAVDESGAVDHGSVTALSAVAVVTPTAFQAACDKLPEPIQGLDGWVTDLSTAGDGTHRLRLAPADLEADLDVAFYDAACTQVGALATIGLTESGPIPPGTAWAVITSFTGAAEFDVHVTSNLRRVRLGAAPAAATAEAPTQVLAVTGAESQLIVGAVLLLVALAVRRSARRPGLNSGAGRDRTSDQTIMSRPL